MNPVRRALAQKLKDDEALMALATGGVHFKQAPSGAKVPYVIFQRSAETGLRAFDGPTLDKGVWIVKAVGEAEIAEDIDRRCLQLLNNSTLDIEGYESLDVHWIGVIDYAETDEGERFDHVGHEYKIDTEESEEV